MQKESASSPVILAKGLGADKVYYLRENQERFPGVSVERVFARDYKQGAIAAHLFGNVGEVTAEQLKEPRYAGLEQGDLVGQSGIEYEYDRFLRGKAGTDRVQVDALGRPTRQLEGKPAEAGDNVRLTIDADLQAYGEGALGSFGLPGAFVVDERRGRRDPGDGLGPQLRSLDLHPADHPAAVPRPHLAEDRRAPGQPGDPGALPDRVGVQADHRDGGAPGRADRPEHDRQRRRQAQGRHGDLQERRRRDLSARST